MNKAKKGKKTDRMKQYRTQQFYENIVTTLEFFFRVSLAPLSSSHHAIHYLRFIQNALIFSTVLTLEQRILHIF